MAPTPFSVDICDPTPPKELPVHLSLQVYAPNVLTRSLWWPSRRSGPPTAVLLFICGNPGIPTWYIEFIDAIRQRASSSSIAFLAVGHIGHAHDLPQPKDTRHLSLESQVEAAGYAQAALLEAFPGVSLILVGHSIGGYIAMQLARDNTHVSLVIGIQPTISHMAQTPNGKLLRHFFKPPFPQILSVLGYILVVTLPFLLPILYRTWSKHSLTVLKNFLTNPQCTLAAMTMAGDEMVHVMELDVKLLAHLRPRLHILYSHTDLWVGSNSDEVIRVLGEDNASRVKFTPVPHAFCISHSVETALAILPWVNEVTMSSDDNVS